MQQGEKRASDDTVTRNRALAMLSHDLRSALTSVIGSLEQINVSSPAPDLEAHRAAAMIAATDATQLLDGILDLEAIEAADFRLNAEPIQSSDFLADLQTRWSDRAAIKGVDLVIDVASDLPQEIEIDRSRLSRVLGNVIENAIKHTTAGQVTVTVSLAEPGTLTFVVRDQGPGFSDAARDLLFSFGGRPAGSAHSGSGLGLYIAKTLMDHMSGDIEVANDGGAVVTLSVPFKSDAPAAMPSLSVLRVADLPDLSHLSILLAEDNATNQMVVTQMLAALGARATVASDGIEALDTFDRGRFDLMLLDIEMPRLSGIDVIKRIRADTSVAARTPIIALTAFAMREHRERIMAAGADGIIAKPIIGVDAFGRDILRLMRRSGVQGALPGSAPDGAVSADPISLETFRALESAIGEPAMGELLAQVRIDLDTVSEGLVRSDAEPDHDPLRRASHVLISVAGAIGAHGTQAHAEALNRAAHANDIAAIDAGIAECLTGIGEIHKFLATR